MKRSPPIVISPSPDERRILEACVERLRLQLPPGAKLTLNKFVLDAALKRAGTLNPPEEAAPSRR